MRILLTGASGFLGKNFLENAPKDAEITAIYNSSDHIEGFVRERSLANVTLHQCDFTDVAAVRRLFDKIGSSFDNCIYLAGNVDIPFSMKFPADDLNRNAGAIVNFLQNCGKIEKFVYMSSAAVYDGQKGLVTAGAKLNPKLPYCISKLAAEQYVKFFQKIGAIGNYAILRFGGAYGRWSDHKFAYKLVKDICMENRDEIEVYGDGTNYVNLMYAKDAVRALIGCLGSIKENILCNLGQDNMTIASLVNRVAGIFGKNVKIKYVPQRGDQKYITFYYDSDFNEIFGFKPRYTFEEGIGEFGEIMKNEA